MTYLSSSIGASPEQTLVNTVNVVERRYSSKLEYIEVWFKRICWRYEQNGITAKLR